MSADYKDLGIRERESGLEQAITDACTRLSMATTQDQAEGHRLKVPSIIHAEGVSDVISAHMGAPEQVAFLNDDHTISAEEMRDICSQRRKTIVGQ